MAIKFTILGGLIYTALLLHAFAALWLLLRFERPGRIGLALGSVVAAAAVALRWVQAGHAPMGNLFEVFLVMAALTGPLAAACRYWGGADGLALDALLGAALLVPAGFVFDAEPRPLAPALQTWLFIPHVGAYLLAYVLLAKAAVQAAGHLAHVPPAAGAAPRQTAAYRMVRLALPPLTAGLVLGAVWGKQAWGNWWNWDPKELWSLATWLTFVLYLHVRALTGGRRPRLEAALILAGAALVVITLLWANLSRLFAGLHSYAT
ncbi:MAG: cytochrome c biogenesis protein CcsA [Planctomycetes bacterium]|nr:cytochrome c biogenesis protein CcsA [Planctomycetota bacterium]